MNEHLNRAEKLVGFAKLDPENTDLLRDLAQCYHLGGNQELALEVYDRLIALSGETPVLLNAKSAALLAQGRWSEAAELLTRAVDAESNVGSLHFNLGYAQLGAGAAREAITNLRRAAELEAGNPRVHYYLALAYDESGDSDKAEQTLARVTALEPDHHDAMALSVHIQMARGRIDLAKRALAQLTEKHPRSAEGYWLKGLFELLNFDATQALVHLQHAQDLAPNDASILISIGQANLMLQRAGAATRVLSRAVMLDTKEPMAHVALGWAHLFENHLNDAALCFEAALRLDPELADAYAGIALIYTGKEQTAQAQDALNKAKQIDPANLAVLLTEGALENKKGNPEIGKMIIQELMQANSVNQLGWTNQQMMDQAKSSPTGQRVADKWARYLRRKQGGAGRLH